MNAARKAGDKNLVLVLGTTLAAIKNRELDLGRAANDPEVVDILRKGVKTRKESVEQFTTAKRQDLADKEAAEIRILEQFLPPAVDPAEIRAAVRAAIAAEPPTSAGSCRRSCRNSRDGWMARTSMASSARS
jgi:Uncharacterized conserved protein